MRLPSACAMTFLLVSGGAAAEPRQYSGHTPEAEIHVAVSVSDGFTNEGVGAVLFGVEAAAGGEILGLINPVLDMDSMTFRSPEGGSAATTIGTAAIPLAIHVEPGTRIAYEAISTSGCSGPCDRVYPQFVRDFDTGNVTSLNVAGTVELLGEEIPFALSLPDFAMAQSSSAIRARARTSSAALDEFLLEVPAGGSLRMQGGFNQVASLANSAGLSVRISLSLEFLAPSIRFGPEASSMPLSTTALRALLIILCSRRGERT